MLKYILKRLVYGIGVLFGVVILVFFLFQLTRIHPERQLAGDKADKQTIENIKRELGLDLPVAAQLKLYLNDISPLSFYRTKDTTSRYYLNKEKYSYVKLIQLGQQSFVLKKPYLSRSYMSKRSVSEILSQRIPNTLVLAITAMIFATFVGIVLGVLAAVKPNSILDRACTTGSVLGISFPSFFAGIILQLLFAYLLASVTGLNMTGDLYALDEYTGESYLELKNLILPAIALGIRPVAVITQLTRGAMLDVMHQDYIRTARAKGLNEKIVLFKHALKNTMVPVTTSVSGWLASLLTGAFFIETIFNYNGIGYETVNALKTFDYPVAMGAILYTAFIFVVISILADILYSVIDPRIRVKG